MQENSRLLNSLQPDQWPEPIHWDILGSGRIYVTRFNQQLHRHFLLSLSLTPPTEPINKWTTNPISLTRHALLVEHVMVTWVLLDNSWKDHYGIEPPIKVCRPWRFEHGVAATPGNRFLQLTAPSPLPNKHHENSCSRNYLLFQHQDQNPHNGA